MEINDTIQTLGGIRQAIDAWVPRSGARPDALIADLNEVYVGSAKNRDFDELFEYDDVGSPSITLVVSIDVDVNIKKVMENLRTRLHIVQPGRADEIGNAGIVWAV